VVLTKRWESVGETMISHVFWMKLAFLVWKLTAVCISISLWRCTGSDKKHPWNWTWEARRWFYNGESWTTWGSSARSCGCCIYVGAGRCIIEAISITYNSFEHPTLNISNQRSTYTSYTYFRWMLRQILG
jgi:hypothetical protein